MSRPRPDAWILPLVLAGVIVGWEIAVRAGQISALFFPAPSSIAQTLGHLILSGDLLKDVAATISRLGLGLTLGGGAGLLLGLLMGWSQRLRGIIDPLIAALHPVPKISILPLVIIIFGIGEGSKIVLVAVACFFPLLINTMAGVREISPVYFEVAHNYGASLPMVFRRVVIPGSLPLILTGARLALNTALVVTIAIELLTAREGLGATIWLAWTTLRTGELYAALLTTALLGIVSHRILHLLTHRLIPWQEQRNL